ncbi:MAG: hypothetical protein NTV81_02960 [Candidatus Komeilibacteria bacterium]|nr:hypothetical protein [Candidatus Komeilibacteria bacterium]
MEKFDPNKILVSKNPEQAAREEKARAERKFDGIQPENLEVEKTYQIFTRAGSSREVLALTFKRVENEEIVGTNPNHQDGKEIKVKFSEIVQISSEPEVTKIGL